MTAKDKVQVNLITSGTTTSLQTILPQNLPQNLPNLPQNYRFKVLFPCMSLFTTDHFIKFLSFILKNKDTKKNQWHMFNTYRLMKIQKISYLKAYTIMLSFSFPTLDSNNNWQEEERVWLTLNCSSNTIGYFGRFRVKKFQDVKVPVVSIPINNCLISS